MKYVITIAGASTALFMTFRPPVFIWWQGAVTGLILWLVYKAGENSVFERIARIVAIMKSLGIAFSLENPNDEQR